MSGMPSGPLNSFLCDQNLRRLGKWLRIMGFDTLSMRNWDDELVRQARRADRIVLTRRVSMQGRDGFVYLGSDVLADQVRQLQTLFELKASARPFTRCSRCNTVLEPIAPPAVKGRVPEYVFMQHERFVECPGCGRIYWPGTHLDRVEEMLKSVLG
jgi:uncharacterized protein